MVVRMTAIIQINRCTVNLSTKSKSNIKLKTMFKNKQSNHPQSKGSLDLLINGSMVRIFFSHFLDEEYVKRACVDLSKKSHDYYFGSYSNFYIHEEMLKDTVRTRAY